MSSSGELSGVPSGRTNSTRTNVDDDAALKAFILIGGVDGVEEIDLRKALLKVHKKEIRRILKTNLHETFLSCNARGNGTLDLNEFQDMIKNFDVIEEAIHDFLQLANEGGDAGTTEDGLKIIDKVGIFLTCFNTACLAFSADFYQGWSGWQLVEALFVVAFSVEIVYRIYQSAELWEALQQHDGRQWMPFVRNGVLNFFQKPLNLLDVAITVTAATDLILIMCQIESSSLGIFTLLRMLRLTRLGRLLKIIYTFPDLALLVEGIMSGLKLVGWSFVLIDMVAIIWAVILRQIASMPLLDYDGKFQERFPTFMTTMSIVYRCTVLHADCVDSNGVSIFQLISEYTGWFGSFPWFCTEVFVVFGVLNVVTSVFVVSAMKNDHAYMQKKMDIMGQEANGRDSLHELDNLVHALAQAQRQGQQQHADAQTENVDEVIKHLNKEYPLSVSLVPDVNHTVMMYSRSIEDSKAQYKEVLDRYKAKEHKFCTKLFKIPSARIYSVGHVEKLLVTKQHPLAESESELKTEAEHDSGKVNLGMEIATDDAVEIPLLQRKHVQVNELLEEAEKVQQHVKSIIWPQSSWASTRGVGSSGHLWKESKHLCDEAFDPGIKKMPRIKAKVEMKFGGKYELNHDYCRLGLIYYSVEHLLTGLVNLLQRSAKGTDGIEVVCIENRFQNPTPLGWRNIKVLLSVQVPSSNPLNPGVCGPARPYLSPENSDKDHNHQHQHQHRHHDHKHYHVMELQMQLKDLVETRDRLHDFHNRIRGALPEEAVHTILDRLASGVTDQGITKEEWLYCIQNDKVRSLLDDLGVPLSVRKEVIDVVDADGTGTVSSAELRKGLVMCVCSGVPQTHELADCRLKVREMQQWLYHHLEPQVHVLRDMLDSMNRASQLKLLKHSAEIQKTKPKVEAKLLEEDEIKVPTPKFVLVESTKVQPSVQMKLPSPMLFGGQDARNHLGEKDEIGVQLNKETQVPIVSAEFVDEKGTDTVLSKDNALGKELVDENGVKVPPVANLLRNELQDLKSSLMHKTRCLAAREEEIVWLKAKIKTLSDRESGTLELHRKTCALHEKVYDILQHSSSTTPNYQPHNESSLSI